MANLDTLLLEATIQCMEPLIIDTRQAQVMVNQQGHNMAHTQEVGLHLQAVIQTLLHSNNNSKQDHQSLDHMDHPLLEVQHQELTRNTQLVLHLQALMVRHLLIHQLQVMDHHLRKAILLSHKVGHTHLHLMPRLLLQEVSHQTQHQLQEVVILHPLTLVLLPTIHLHKRKFRLLQHSPIITHRHHNRSLLQLHNLQVELRVRHHLQLDRKALRQVCLSIQAIRKLQPMVPQPLSLQHRLHKLHLQLKHHLYLTQRPLHLHNNSSVLLVVRHQELLHSIHHQPHHHSLVQLMPHLRNDQDQQGQLSHHIPQLYSLQYPKLHNSIQELLPLLTWPQVRLILGSLINHRLLKAIMVGTLDITQVISSHLLVLDIRLTQATHHHQEHHKDTLPMVSMVRLRGTRSMDPHRQAVVTHPQQAMVVTVLRLPVIKWAHHIQVVVLQVRLHNILVLVMIKVVATLLISLRLRVRRNLPHSEQVTNRF